MHPPLKLIYFSLSPKLQLYAMISGLYILLYLGRFDYHAYVKGKQQVLQELWWRP